MKASELRIGNYYNGDGIYYKIDITDLQNIIDDPQDDFYQPIPLTEEILLKCGFESIKTIVNRGISSRRFYHIGNFVVEILANNRAAIYYTRMQELICYIESLHQLQNLYFALTGEELNINI